MSRFGWVNLSSSRMVYSILFVAATLAILPIPADGQTATTYSARTDRLLQLQTPMDPPAVNAVFQDPDFGSNMVRVTDANTNPSSPGLFYRNASVGDQNTWAVDESKFYVIDQNGQMKFFAFDPLAMQVTPISNPQIRAEAEFSFADPDLVYGTSGTKPYVIQSYRFSSGTTTQIFDTNTCGVQPALNPKGTSGTISVSAQDERFALVEGGVKSDTHFVVAVYDAALGCEWYNTQTGQVGGQWGTPGAATITAPYTIRGGEISRDGNYVFILSNAAGGLEYIWQLGTRNVTVCYSHTSHCGGYEAIGYSDMVNSTGYIDEMNPWKRPLNNISDTEQLVVPLKTPHGFGMVQRWAWTNADPADSVPVCGTTFEYSYNDVIDGVWDGEIDCIETDGLASTVWRFAHNRSAVNESYFNTQPLGNISHDGHYYLFTTDWNNLLGIEVSGNPRSDVFIVQLE
jgi:hypothetical protein